MTPDVELAIRIFVFLAMIVVGLDLHVRDFVPLRSRPRLIVGVVALQWVALVAVAGVMGRLLGLSDGARAGALLFAAAPVGALSCIYAQLAGGQLALATTLTAVSTLCAGIVSPFIAALGFRLFLGAERQFEISTLALFRQALAGLVLPLMVGMIVGRRFPAPVARWRTTLRRAGILIMVSLLAVIVAGEFATIRAQLADALLGAAMLTLAMLAIGYWVARIATTAVDFRHAIPWGFAARNVAVAALLGVNVESKSAATAFVAVLAITQLALLIPIALALRRRAPAQAASGLPVTDAAPRH